MRVVCARVYTRFSRFTRRGNVGGREAVYLARCYNTRVYTKTLRGGRERCARLTGTVKKKKKSNIPRAVY